MNIAEAPFFSALRARLDVMGQRQRLVAENLANASTPDYRPRDVDVKGFEKALAAQFSAPTARKDGIGAVGAQGAGGAGRSSLAAHVRVTPDAEVTLDGNAVVLEDQMLKANETRAAYETALALYQKGLQLVRLAARPPGR